MQSLLQKGASTRYFTCLNEISRLIQRLWLIELSIYRLQARPISIRNQSKMNTPDYSVPTTMASSSVNTPVLSTMATETASTANSRRPSNRPPPRRTNPLSNADRATKLSKNLSYVLRHGAIKEGYNIRSDGFIKVAELVGFGFQRDKSLSVPYGLLTTVFTSGLL